MADSIKLLASSVSVNSTPNNISTASLVRLVNVHTAPLLITQALANGTAIGTIILAGSGGDGSCIDLMKEPTDTVAANTATANLVHAVSIGFY
jgi:hypothetical protein